MSSPLTIQIKAEVDREDIQVCRFTVDRPVESAPFRSIARTRRAETHWRPSFSASQAITRVDLNENLVTVAQSGGEDWRQLGKRIGTAIRSFLNPPPDVPEGDRLPSEEVRRRVQQVLDDQINPGVAAHGGFVELIDVQDDNIYIRMGGGCQGCGAADVTLKMGVERLIREQVPQVHEILDTTDHAGGSNPYYAPSK